MKLKWQDMLRPHASAERASAATPDVAKRRAYSGLAERVWGTFAAELNANLGK
jgi:hypothetical protein